VDAGWGLRVGSGTLADSGWVSELESNVSSLAGANVSATT